MAKFKVTLHCSNGVVESKQDDGGQGVEEAIRLARCDLSQTAGDVRKVETELLPEEEKKPAAKKSPAKKDAETGDPKKK